MTAGSDFEVVRDPLWNNIRLDSGALALLDSPPVQRLRYVRQLGHAFLVYPGATHTRFEHALGTYHLARRTISLLRERGDLDHVEHEEIELIKAAAMLHDLGHYPFSHALEEAGLPTHESLTLTHLEHNSIEPILEGIRSGGVREVDALVRGASHLSLAGLISGALDLDKIEYLTRDARMTGVPYGTVDVDRLLNSITLLPGVDDHRIAIHEKGVSALESLLFAKYQMYRNVYWHHGVRSATCMFKRLVRDAIATGLFDADWIALSTDESLMERLKAADFHLAERLRNRRLYKRALDTRGSELSEPLQQTLSDPVTLAAAENRLADAVGLRHGELLIDLPTKKTMLSAEIDVLRRDGKTFNLAEVGPESGFGIQQVAEELYATARRLRVFTAREVSRIGIDMLEEATIASV